MVRGVGKYAAMLPPAMADDEPLVRAYLTAMARREGFAVADAARLTMRVLTELPIYPPEESVGPMLFADIETV